MFILDQLGSEKRWDWDLTMRKINNLRQCTPKGVIHFINYITEKCNIAGREKFKWSVPTKSNKLSSK